jgi:hypothetical protein
VLIQQRAVEAFNDPVGLQPLHPCRAMLDFLQLQTRLTFESSCASSNNESLQRANFCFLVMSVPIFGVNGRLDNAIKPARTRHDHTLQGRPTVR